MTGAPARSEPGTMGDEMAIDSRTAPLRADAERNRRRLIDAASELFAERGIDASIAEIRERAGVGQGTVFRHFPTKEHLMAQVMRERMADLIALAEDRLTIDDPAAALHDFMSAAAQGKSVDQDIYRAICETNTLPPEDERELRGRLIAAIGALLARAQAAGEIRDDVTPEDVMLLEGAASYAGGTLGQIAPELWRRYIDLMFDGLRPSGAHPLSHPAPTSAQLDEVMALRNPKTCG
jgi:AcrR family transcriptional regulator